MEATFTEVVAIALWLISLHHAGKGGDANTNMVIAQAWNATALALTVIAFIILVKWFAPPLI